MLPEPLLCVAEFVLQSPPQSQNTCIRLTKRTLQCTVNSTRSFQSQLAWMCFSCLKYNRNDFKTRVCPGLLPSSCFLKQSTTVNIFFCCLPFPINSGIWSNTKETSLNYWFPILVSYFRVRMIIFRSCKYEFALSFIVQIKLWSPTKESHFDSFNEIGVMQRHTFVRCRGSKSVQGTSM